MVVQSVVLDGGNGLHVLTAVRVGFHIQIAHHAFREGAGQHTGNIGVFTVCFVGTTPNRRALHVDSGAPVGQATTATAFAGRLAVTARIVRNRVGDHFDVLFVPGLRQAQRHRVRGTLGRAVLDAVQRFVPVVVLGKTQTRHRGAVTAQLVDLFVQGQTGHQVRCAFLERQRGIHERILGSGANLLSLRRGEPAHAGNRQHRRRRHGQSPFGVLLHLHTSILLFQSLYWGYFSHRQ